MCMGRRKGSVSILGWMGVVTKVTGKMTNKMDLARTSGLTGLPISDNLRITKCMVSVRKTT